MLEDDRTLAEVELGEGVQGVDVGRDDGAVGGRREARAWTKVFSGALPCESGARTLVFSARTRTNSISGKP